MNIALTPVFAKCVYIHVKRYQTQLFALQFCKLSFTPEPAGKKTQRIVSLKNKSKQAKALKTNIALTPVWQYCHRKSIFLPGNINAKDAVYIVCPLQCKVYSQHLIISFPGKIRWAGRHNCGQWMSNLLAETSTQMICLCSKEVFQW